MATNVKMWRTFHDVDQRAHISLFDDTALFFILYRIHAVHDLLDLRQLQILHEVIVKNCLFDEFFRPVVTKTERIFVRCEIKKEYKEW